MNENPYSQIVSLLRQEMPGQFLRIGTVSGTSPLSVSVGGIQAGGAQLYCNPLLLSEEMPADITISGQKSTGSIRFTRPLKVGDRVILFSDEDQVFYILCKVVGV